MRFVGFIDSQTISNSSVEGFFLKNSFLIQLNIFILLKGGWIRLISEQRSRIHPLSLLCIEAVGNVRVSVYGDYHADHTVSPTANNLML